MTFVWAMCRPCNFVMLFSGVTRVVRADSKEAQENPAAQKAIETGIGAGEAPGTLHFSAVDREGGMVSMTLTHGASFGACVTVPGLGLTLGHGMTRFDAGTPNSMGPRKRP